MREQHDPVVADEFVEIDWACGGFGLEVGGRRAEADAKRGGGRLAILWVTEWEKMEMQMRRYCL